MVIISATLSAKTTGETPREEQCGNVACTKDKANKEAMEWRADSLIQEEIVKLTTGT